MDKIEGRKESDVRRGIREVIERDLMGRGSIDANLVAKVAYKKLGFDRSAPRLVKDTTTAKLVMLAIAVLREMFEPDQSPEQAREHARQLEAYGRSHGLIK